MTTQLTELVLDAREEGRDPSLEVFLRIAPEATRRGIWALSIAVALTPPDLAALLRDIWADLADADATVERLRTHPFVVVAGQELRVIEPMVGPIAADFAEADAPAFARAHRLLVALEERRENAADPLESWFTRGRIAFYLAGLDPERSVRAFGQVFASPPAFDRVSCRIWVTSLVLRQQPLLTSQARELAFYRGFRLHVTGHRSEAREAFEAVIQDPQEDEYRAIALHLLGVILRRRDPEKGVALLEESIALSEELGLLDNELLARTSLVWALLSRSGAGGEAAKADLGRAHEQGEANLARLPTDFVDLGLIAGVRFAAVVAHWEWLRRVTNDQARLSAVGAQLLGVLRHNVEIAHETGDFHELVLAGNFAAQINNDLGNFEAAIEEVEDVVTTVRTLRSPPANVRRLAQTTGTIITRAKDPDLYPRGTGLLAVIDDLQTRSLQPFAALPAVEDDDA